MLLLFYLVVIFVIFFLFSCDVDYEVGDGVGFRRWYLY